MNTLFFPRLASGPNGVKEAGLLSPLAKNRCHSNFTPIRFDMCLGARQPKVFSFFGQKQRCPNPVRHVSYQKLVPSGLEDFSPVRQPPFAVPATLHKHCRLHACASEPGVCAAPYVLVVLLSVMYCRRRLLRALRAHACRGGNPFCACVSGDTQYTRMPRACVRARVGETLTSERCGVLSQLLMPRCDAPLAAWRGPLASSL